MADRYWVGGSGTWDGSNTANWSASSGGASGASVPTSADSVFFDQAATYTVTMSGSLPCLDFTVSAGTVTFSTAAGPSLNISGSMSLIAGTVFNIGFGGIIFNSTTNGRTITTNGVTLSMSTSSSITFNGTGGGWTLGSALTTNGTLNITRGSFNTGNYALTAAALFSSNSNTRAITLGSSTVTLSDVNPIAFNTNTGLTFNAGTSTITCTAFLAIGFAGGPTSSTGVTFYNVAFTGAAQNTITIQAINTFNNITITGPSSVGILPVVFTAQQTINGALSTTSTAGNRRVSLFSNTYGTSRSLIINSAPSIVDVDFRDIVVTGSASPISGTRIGNCAGNSGITFSTPKTVYWSFLTGGDWWQNAWSTSSGGGVNTDNFPLPQDTAIIENTGLNSAANIAFNRATNLPTMSLSTRTNSTTLQFSTFAHFAYGNWAFGSGTNTSGTGSITFAGRGSQTITSAGKSFSGSINIDVLSGSVTLQDAFSPLGDLSIVTGTFDANNYNVSVPNVFSSNTNTRTINIGSGTWLIYGSTGWITSTITGLTVTGTGTISMSRSAAITFNGGGIQTWPTINQANSGALTISGSNKFQNITNTRAPFGATTVRFAGGSVNEFVNFNLTGSSSGICTLTSNTTTQAILRKVDPWYMGANSTDSGNNSNLIFTAGGGIDYLNVSYINGQGPITNTNFLLMFI